MRSVRNRIGSGHLALVASLALTVGCQPADERPGLWLSSELGAEPVRDWSFSDAVEEISVETRTWYGIPHSVTIWGATQGGRLYLPSLYYDEEEFPNGRLWNRNVVRYPGERLAQDLSIVARMIAGGLGTRIYYVALGGFDTHANQLGAQNNLLRRYAQAVSAFQRDLTAMGLSRRVVTVTFSEFGRRVRENASGGTDHGTAAPMIVMGDGIRPGLAGRRPSLTDLDNGDLKHTTDFRSVYASLLSQWFEIDPATILFGKKFPELNLVRS